MAYLTADETTALLLEMLPSTDPRRRAFYALDAGDKGPICEQAAQDLDQCRWQGRRQDLDQVHAFPRVSDGGYVIELRNDPGPTGASAWTVAGIPIEIRRAAALQAGKRALDAFGQDDTRLAQKQAAAGITSQQAGGRGIVNNGTVAQTAWANLDSDAQRQADPLRRMGGNAA